jgi:hypothetical protein
MLISSSWFDVWGDPNVKVLERDVADHCPLVLRYNEDDWGPKPFRFNNFLLKNRDFKSIILQAWEAQHVQGWMGYILKERLKNLKGVVKEWSRRTYGVDDVKKKRIINDIAVLDLKSETSGLMDMEVEERKKLFDELWKILKSIDAMTFQRSRSRWLKEGDSNSRYFHNCIKARNRRNRLVALKTTNGWVEGPTQVRAAVVDFFRNHFTSHEWQRPKYTLDGIDFPSLSQERVLDLTACFTLEEINGAVRGCDGSKSPGPDGFNFAFIKEFWEVMNGDIRIMFDQFHGNAKFPRGMISYFLALIPKVDSPQALGDFRPISLLGCLYKIIAKVLATRLARVMGELISNTQSAFIKGRHLVDSVVVVNEVVDFAKKKPERSV